ncbi:MAG: 5'/3'-nucleotidase SurE [Myxococcota bacterium]
MSSDRPLILLSNDDGFDAAGLIALRKALARFADVVVCAPATNQSATSHKLTLTTVLRLRRIDPSTFALDGTPADCIYVALHSREKLLPRWPDLVVSGMNHGPNLGVDVVYSGTVAAAREAAHRGIPAVAVSADVRADRDAAARCGADVVARVWRTWSERPGPREADPGGPAPLLNVNIPPGAGPWPVRATTTGRRRYDDDVVYREDPRGREYLWIGGFNVRHDAAAGSDTEAWDRGAASVTPLTLDVDESRHRGLATAAAGDG